MKNAVTQNNENIRVTKHFTFEMAHALYNYNGPCRNIHGHSYKLSVTCIGKPMISIGNPKDGLVIDFKDIKEAVQKEVLDHLDHALVLNKAIPGRVPKSLYKQYGKVVLLPFQPSCENLVIEIKNRLSKVFNKRCTLYAIKLKETHSSWAEWCLSDNQNA